MSKWFSLFWILLSLQCTAQNGPVYLWQGFQHHWGYNHRLNRLGDYLEASENQWTWTHTAASGSGADMGSFSSHAAKIDRPDLWWRSGEVEMELRGGEMEMVEERVKIRVPMEGQLEMPTVVLNGFDLQSADGADADKLVALEMGVDSLRMEGGEMMAELYCKVQLSCRSPECERGDKAIHYRAQLHWLALGLPGKAGEYEGGYAYAKRGPVKQAMVQPLKVAVRATGQGAVAHIHGFKKFGFSLAAEDHIAGYWMGIQPNGNLKGQLLAMGLAQRWKGMRRAYRHYYHGFPKLPAWIAVKKKSGEVRVWAELMTMELPAEQVSFHESKGERFWDSTYRHPRSASDSLAVFRKNL